MDTVSELSKLKELLRELSALESKKTELLAACDQLEQAKAFNAGFLDDFDETCRARFIENRIGKAPKAPKLALLAVEPVSYSVLRIRYENKKKEYDAKYAEILPQYLKAFEAERAELTAKDDAVREERIRAAEQAADAAEAAVNETESRIKNCDFLAEEYLKPDTVFELIDCMERGPAGTIEEAIGVLKAEEERKKQLEAEQQAKQEKRIKAVAAGVSALGGAAIATAVSRVLGSKTKEAGEDDSDDEYDDEYDDEEYDDSERLSPWEAAEIWRSSGMDEDYLFGYTEDELRKY